MKTCPKNCGSSLIEIERDGVEIDYCTQCRGVWLDRGELEKLIEKAAAFQPAPVPNQPVPQQPQYQAPAPQYQPPAPQYQHPHPPQPGYPPQYKYDDDYDDYYKKRKKKKGFLGEIFDFD